MVVGATGMHLQRVRGFIFQIRRSFVESSIPLFSRPISYNLRQNLKSEMSNTAVFCMNVEEIETQTDGRPKVTKQVRFKANNLNNEAVLVHMLWLRCEITNRRRRSNWIHF